MSNRRTLNKFYGRCQSGRFVPTNKDKYLGNWRNITYRSKLELASFVKMDKHPSVIEWSSETVIVPYFLYGHRHRYYVDLYVKVIDVNKQTNKYLVEIKHSNKLKRPPAPKTKKGIKTYKVLCEEYDKNQAKWKYAREYARERDMKFLIWTEQVINGF